MIQYNYVADLLRLQQNKLNLQHRLVCNWCGGELDDEDLERANAKKAELRVLDYTPQGEVAP